VVSEMRPPRRAYIGVPVSSNRMASPGSSPMKTPRLTTRRVSRSVDCPFDSPTKDSPIAPTAIPAAMCLDNNNTPKGTFPPAI
jgi:hypothetical protein